MASQDLNVVFRYLPEKYRKAYAEGKLSNDDLLEWGRASGVIEADFSNVKGSSDTVPATHYPSLPRPVDHALTALDSVQGLGEDVANTLKGATKTFVGSKEFTAADTGNSGLANLAQGLTDQFDMTHGGSVGGLISNIRDPKRMSLDSIAHSGGDLFQEGEKQVEAANQSAQGRVTGPTVGKIATGIASMPSALLGVAGGPSATIPSADYFTQEYTKARLAGLDHEHALNEAGIKAAAMEAVATVPAGSIFGRVGAKSLMGDAAKTGLNIASNMAGEGVKMDLITGSQLATDKWFSEFSNDKKTKDYSTANLPDDIMGVFDAMKDSTLMGMTMGVTQAPHELIQTAAQRGKLAAEMVHGQVSSEKDMAAERAKTTAPTLDQTIPTQGDLFGTPAGLPSHEQFMADRQKQAELDALQNVGQKHDLADKRDRINRLLGLDVTTAQGAQDGNTMADAFRRAGITDQLAGLPRAPGEQPAPLRPLGEQQNLPLNEPLQPADAETLRKQMADKRARDAAEALVSEDKNVSMDKLKSQHQAERRKAINSIVENSRGIENHDERIAHVAEATAAWDNENSLASFIGKRQAEMNKKYKDPRQQTAKPAIPEAPVSDTTTTAPGEAPVTADEQAKFDQMKKDLGLSSAQGTGQNTGVTTEHVFDAIGDSLHKGSSKVAAKLIADKNLVVVDSAEHIPADAIQQGTGGYYDGKRTYVVAGELDPNNIMGGLLNVAAHEVKHGADFAASEKVRGNIGNIIGHGANKRLNAKIEALAQSDSEHHPVKYDQLGSELTPAQEDMLTPAQKAVHAARIGSTDATSYGLELPAYFINAARGARDAKSGSGQLRENITAAVRNAAKRRFGDKADVNLNDMAYLSDKLLHDVAKDGNRLTVKDGATLDHQLPMIAGKKATGYGEADSKDRTYMSVDGNRKFVFSDKNSSLKTHNLDELVQNGELRLGHLWDHPDLYKHYPEAAYIPVTTVPDDPEYAGFYHNGEISITDRSLERGMSDPNSLKELLLHEVQHYVQDVEGHANGSNKDMFKTADERKTVDDYTTAVNGLDHLAKAITAIPLGTLARDEKAGESMMRLRDDYRAKRISQSEFLKDTIPLLDNRDNTAGQDMKQRILRQLESTKNLAIESNKINEAARQKYMNTLGEQEARFTEANHRRSTEDMPRNPETAPKGEGFDAAPVEDSVIVRNGKVIGVAKETTQGKLAIAMNEKAMKEGSPGLAFNAKQFRDATKNFVSPDNKAIRLLRSMFSYHGNLGKELNEMREDSTGEAALYSHRAMNALARINTGISQLAEMGVKRGVYKTRAEGEAAFKKQINDKLESISKLEDASRREAALAAYVRDNPAMRPVMDAVNDIQQLSRTLLIQMVKTHPDPTPEQLRSMTTIHENYFRYATRMYAAFQGEAGREHSAKMIKEYEKGKKALATGEIPEKFKESFRVVNDALRHVIDNDLSIPDREGLEAADTDKLNNLFTTWVGNADETRQRVRAQARADGHTHAQADQMVRETLISALEARSKDVNEADLQGKSMDVVRGMLDLNPSDSPFATFYRGFAQDRSILEHRERLPQEIKDLFGEIKDPATRLAVTIAKQGELAARTRLLLDMRDHGTGQWVIKGTDAGLPGNERFTVPLKGESYGPLRDYRTTPAIADAIGKNLEMYSTLTQAIAKSYNNTQAMMEALARTGLHGLSRAAGTQKLVGVVFDLYNIGQNFVGSPLGAIANGVVDPRYYLSGLKTGGEVVVDTLFDNQGKMSPDFQDAVRYGMIDSARVQEIRATPQRTIRNMITDETKAYRHGKSMARRGVRTVVETFAMSDAWIKISVFKQRVDVLSKFYKAEGVTKSLDEIKRQAADEMKNTTITYSRVPPIIKGAEAIGATTFMPYFYSVPRSISHNYILGVKDLINAAHAKSSEGSITMAMSGMQRLAGATAATYGFTALLKGAAAAINGPDKDKADEMKKLMAEDARFSDSVYLGKDKTNVPLFARLSRIDPFGPTNDIMRVYLNDKLSPEEKSRFAMKLFGDLFFSNRVTQTLIRGLASSEGEDIKSKHTKLERLAPAAVEKAKDFLMNVGHMNFKTAGVALEMVDSFVPGIMDTFDPRNQAPTTIKNNDPWFKALSDMVILSGGRLDRADPSLAAYSMGQELEQARYEGRTRMKDGFAAGSDPADLVTRFQKAATAEYMALRHASTIYEGMTNGLGYTPRQASDVLKNDGSLTPVDINGVRTGRITSEADSWVNQHSQILSKQSLLQRSKTDEKRMTPEEIKQNRKNINEFLKQMQTMGLKVNNSTKKD